MRQTPLNRFLYKLTKPFKRPQSAWLKLMAAIEARRAFSKRNAPPVIIYQMGKVGSVTVQISLNRANLPNDILHFHFLSPQKILRQKNKFRKRGFYPYPIHIYRGEAIARLLDKKPTGPIKVITLVRDPIAVKISSLFENPKAARENILTPNGEIDASKADAFLERELANPGNFGYINKWFDEELKNMFAIDVFEEPFPVELGHTVYKKGNTEVLLIRLEDLTEKGPTAIADFLKLDSPVKLIHGRARKNLANADVYDQVLSNLHLSSETCETIYASRLARHFYSPAMLAGFTKRWTEGKKE